MSNQEPQTLQLPKLRSYNTTDVGAYFIELIQLQQKNALTPHAIAEALSVLTSIETQPGGPYATSHNEETSSSIDAGVNAAIAYFLQSINVHLPALDSFLTELKNSNLATRLSSEQITQLHNLVINSPSSPSQTYRDIPGEDAMMQRILNLAKNRFASLPDEMQAIAMQEITKTIRGNPDKQMSLMAFYFRQALGEKGNIFSDEFIAELGLANVFFWTSFIIYDNFWDEDEEAHPHILPIANLLARDFISYFNRLIPDPTFFQNIMDKLDAANTWETLTCRTKVTNNIFHVPTKIPDFVNYERKYEPASAHIVGPIIMLTKLGYRLDSDEVKNVTDYFKRYLIAMQLNDDMHDWEEDMRRGNISTVVAMLVEDMENKKQTVNLITDQLELQKLFWFTTLKRACNVTLASAASSREALNRLTVIERKEPLERFIITNEKAAQEALRELETSNAILQAFETKKTA